jgi:small redox-active disulfide protein 2
MLSIKVLGSGCANCKKVEANAQKALTQLGIQAKIEKVTEYPDIMKYQIMSTPGLVINEKVVCSGRIPSESEVVAWLKAAQEAA